MCRIAALLGLTVLALGASPARSADFEVRTANIRLAEGAWTLSARIDYRLTEEATEALENGLTLTFRESEHGAFVAHHYRYAPAMSTFIVECDEPTWRRAGLDRMDDAASRAYCERVFAPDLGGHELVSNKSNWRQFPLLSNAVWRVGNAVLIGDALRSMHFSIGSGTRLAFEDAIALDRAFGDVGEDVPKALAAFERERRPVVEKLFAAASASSYWYEEFPARMARFDALGLAYDYMTRSGRVTPERLRQQAPRFMQGVDVAGLSS